jgi:hypothetical protein
MGLKKGMSNNPNGRKVGTPNKLTKELRATLKAIIEKELETIPETLENLTPEKRLEIVIKLIPYVLPKVESVPMDKGEPVDWSF